ncbi:MAG TPA: hypothetical protein VGM24_02410, partial [Puia sp.]
MKQIYEPTVKTYSTHIKKTLREAIFPGASAGRKGLAVLAIVLGVLTLQFSSVPVFAQDCATSGSHNQTKNENTYYPGTQATVPAGSTSITLGAVPTGYGGNKITSGDIILIIQMQGAQIYVPAGSTSTLYGASTSGLESGFITTNLMAGNMEFAVAANNVPLTGGTLNITAGLTYSYAYKAFGTTGQYTYQVIRVP